MTGESTQTYLYTKPSVFSHFPNVVAAESTRHGGVSPAPFASLNLGINTDDAPANVNENRRRFFAALGAPEATFASSYQVHGTSVLVVKEPGRFEGYDALITNEPDLLVGVTVADCVPILVYDSAHQAVAAIHAGWRGTVGEIVSKTLRTMHEHYGTIASDCYAYVGTCIDECSFEVGPEVAEQFASAFKRIDPNTQRDCVDLKGANRQQLLDFGIPESHISVSSFSTIAQNSDYFLIVPKRGKRDG